MTTNSYAAVVDHTSDAGFRAWGSTLSSHLSTAGLVQTADTGQINWTTVTRPGTNTAAGYEIWRLSNSSLYFKIEYGTAAVATAPQLWVTVGQGSNGSGTVTGQLSTRSTWAQGTTPTSTVIALNTYICVVTDAISILWSNNMTTSVNGGGLCVGRSVDSTGATTSTGFGVLRQAGSNYQFQSVRISSTAATFTDSSQYCLVPGSPSSSLTNAGSNQAYLTFLNVPDVLPFEWAVGYVVAEVTETNTLSVAPVGSTNHAYIATGTTGPNGGAVSYAMAMIYE